VKKAIEVPEVGRPAAVEDVTMSHRRILSLAAVLIASTTVLPALPAQNGPDPMHEIQEIARQVDRQLQEIDRLLLESGRRDQTRQRPKELLQQARERSEEVEKGIDKLIDELNKLKQQRQQSSGSQSQDQQEQQDQQNQEQNQQQQQQRQRNRRENQTPDIAQRPRNQPGQPQEQQGQQQGQQPQQPQPDGQQPNGGQETPDGGQNRRGDQPPDSEVGPAQPGTGDGTWGELQPYVNFLKNRGSMPKVPEKYRKYWEAYLKQKQDGKRK
jgi:DNA mismatch repair ATPase MutL